MSCSELVQIGQLQIEAVCDEAGTPFAALKPMCKTLGLNYSGQLEKLRKRSWAGICQIHTPDKRGRTQPQVFISAKTVPMWLATINENRVDPKVKPSLKVLQDEACDVLYRHFSGQDSRIDLDTVDALTLLNLAQQKHDAELRKVKHLAEGNAAELGRIRNPYGTYVTAMGFAVRQGVHLALSQAQALGRLSAHYCRKHDIPIEMVNDPRFGRVQSYPESVVQLFFDDVVSEGS